MSIEKTYKEHHPRCNAGEHEGLCSETTPEETHVFGVENDDHLHAVNLAETGENSSVGEGYNPQDEIAKLQALREGR